MIRLRHPTVRISVAGTLTSLLIATLMLIPVPEAASHHRALIQPGAMFNSPNGAWCSFNMVFEDPNGGVYIGTAAHCVTTEAGWQPNVDGIGPIGEVVYYKAATPSSNPPKRPRDVYMDFALIRVSDHLRDQVEPGGRPFGGPQEIERSHAPNTPLVHHGQGLIVSSTEATRTRGGTLAYVFGTEGAPEKDHFQGWFSANIAAVGGDSGSLILTTNGNALGVVNWAGEYWGETGRVMGPTFDLIEKMLKEDGWDLEPKFADYEADDPGALLSTATETASHCAANPVSTDPRADACVRPAYPSRRWGEPDKWTDAQWKQASLLATGKIEAGVGPSIEYLTTEELNRVFLDPMTGASLPVTPDSFIFKLPKGIRSVATKTTDGSGIGYDVDIYFSGRRKGHELWQWSNGCATTGVEETCDVPYWARLGEVAAWSGVDLTVEVHGIPGRGRGQEDRK